MSPCQCTTGRKWKLLEQKIHLLLIDPFPPDRRAPQGIHAAIFETFDDDPFQLPADKPLTLAAYECGSTVRGDIEPIAVGESLPSMPVLLAPDRFVEVPLDATYTAAWETVPRRWQSVIAPTN